MSAEAEEQLPQTTSISVLLEGLKADNAATRTLEARVLVVTAPSRKFTTYTLDLAGVKCHGSRMVAGT